MVLVLLGLPVAPVLCDLACPQASSAVALGSGSTPSVAAAHSSAPCHDSTAGEAAAGLAASAPPAATAVLDVSPGHRCEHPRVLAPRAPQSLRLPEPLVAPWHTARLAFAFLALHALGATLAATGAPSPPAGAAFSLVLRI